MLLRNTADDKIWVLQTERLEQVRSQQGRQPSRKHKRQHADSHRLAASLASAAAATAAAAADRSALTTSNSVHLGQSRSVRTDDCCCVRAAAPARLLLLLPPPVARCCWPYGPDASLLPRLPACLLSVSLCVCVCVQIDLSDDYLVFMLFADNGWEEQLLPIQIADESGEASTLEMGEQQFKDYVGLIKTLQEAEQEAREALGGREEDDDGPIDVTAEAAPSNGSKQ